VPTTGAFLDPNCLLRVVTKARGKMGGGRAFLMLKVLIVYPLLAHPRPETRARKHTHGGSDGVAPPDHAEACCSSADCL
jgi:hypothetical protein